MTDETEKSALSPDPAADAKERERQQAVAQVTHVYWESLEALGVSSYVLGVPLGEEPSGHGALRCVGRSDIVLNLIAGLIQMLTPQDFDNLLTEMAVGKYFEAKRNTGLGHKAPVDPATGKPRVM
jgi:hypothetical protein